MPFWNRRDFINMFWYRSGLNVPACGHVRRAGMGMDTGFLKIVVQGFHRKMSCCVCSISLASSMLEGCDISNLKGGSGVQNFSAQYQISR